MDFRQILSKKLNGGPMTESELLDVILANAYGGKHFGALCDRIVARFPSVRAAMTADFNELMAVEGMTEPVALYLMTLGRVLTSSDDDALIEGSEDCIRFALDRLAGCDNEHIEFYLVNKNGKIIKSGSSTSGLADRVDIRLKKVIAALSGKESCGLYFVHNHVNCSVEPSLADDSVTARVMEACAMCGVTFLDHCIVNGRGEGFSYRLSGRLSQLFPSP